MQTKRRLFGLAAAVMACALVAVQPQADAGATVRYKSRSRGSAAQASVQYQAVAPAASYGYGFRASGTYGFAPQVRSFAAYGTAGTEVCPNCGGTIDVATGQHITGPAHAPRYAGTAYVDPSTGAVYPVNPGTGQVYPNTNYGTQPAQPQKPVGDEWRPDYNPPAPSPNPPAPAPEPRTENVTPGAEFYSFRLQAAAPVLIDDGPAVVRSKVKIRD